MIDGLFFKGVEETTDKAPTGGWYDNGKNICGIVLTDKREEARLIEGNINLKSYFLKIYDAVRYSDFAFEKLSIERVNQS
jgi:hypothetical protein